MKTAIIIFTLMSFCLVSCKNSTDATPATFTGTSSWVYSDNTFDSSARIISLTTDTVKISSSSVTNNQKNIKLSDSTNFILDASGSSWVLSEVAEYSGDPLSHFPGRAGDTITVADSIPLNIGGYIHIGRYVQSETQTNTLVTVPAGIFSCSVYLLEIYEDGLLVARDLVYISASVGVVERDYFHFNSKTDALYLFEQKQLLKVQ